MYTIGKIYNEVPKSVYDKKPEKSYKEAVVKKDIHTDNKAIYNDVKVEKGP